MSPQFSPKAIEDIYEISAYLEVDSYEAATRVAAQIFEACDSIAESPYLGHWRSEFPSRRIRVRAITPGSTYLVVYDAEAIPVRILRIVHGARDLRRATT